MRRKTAYCLTFMLAMLFLAFVGMISCANIAAKAEEPPAIVQDGEFSEGEETPSKTDNDNDITEPFIQYLKDEYGEEYEKYYNAIIEQWGSVKAYLNSKIEDGTLTESADNWSLFVNWLDQYSVIWAPILAVVCVIIAFIAGRKVYTVIKNLFNRLFKGTNQTAIAQLAIINALEKLLGGTDKTKEERAVLEKAKEELLKNE